VLLIGHLDPYKSSHSKQQKDQQDPELDAHLDVAAIGQDHDETHAFPEAVVRESCRFMVWEENTVKS
jgi:hypothetical protein